MLSNQHRNATQRVGPAAPHKTYCCACRYKDTFEVLLLSDTYTPDDNSLDTCIGELLAGQCDGQ